jgi:hypothetical protein
VDVRGARQDRAVTTAFTDEPRDLREAFDERCRRVAGLG